MSLVEGAVKLLDIALDLLLLLKTKRMRLQVMLEDVVSLTNGLACRIGKAALVMVIVIAKNAILTRLLYKSLLLVSGIDKGTSFQVLEVKGNNWPQGLLLASSFLLDSLHQLQHLF